MSRIPLTSCSAGYFFGSIVSGKRGPILVRMPRASQVNASRVWPARDNAKAKCAYSLGHESPRQYPPPFRGVEGERWQKGAIELGWVVKPPHHRRDASRI